MKKLFLKLSLILILVGCIIYAQAHYLAPKRFKTRLETVQSELIPSSHHDKNIGVISDLQGDLDALKKITKRLDSAQVDVLFFIGDTFGIDLKEEDKVLFQELLQGITPEYGKFAMIEKESERDDFTDLGFYIVSNTALKLHFGGSDYINVQTVNNTESVDMSNEDIFNILISSQTDISLMSGYDLGIETLSSSEYVSVPFIYNQFKKRINTDSSSVITHMGSSTNHDYRLFTNPELLILTLKSKSQ